MSDVDVLMVCYKKNIGFKVLLDYLVMFFF